MITVKSIVNMFVNWPVLQAAAQAAFGAAYVDCNATDSGASLTVYLTQAVPNQQTTWDGLVGAQDPVFIGQDKALVIADGTDFVTVTVNAPRPGAAPVTLQITQPSGQVVTQPVTMTSGVGSVQIRTFLYGIHQIAVLNPANRCATTLTFLGG